MKKELLISCKCLGEVLSRLKYDDEPDVYITVYRYQFPNLSFWRRIKFVVKVLRGKGIETADVVLSREDFNKIKEFKNE